MKIIKIDLLPEDFDMSVHQYGSVTDCALGRACKRFFKTNNIFTGMTTVEVYYKSQRFCDLYEIKDEFTYHDYLYVKQQYSKPNCNKIFQVTLILK